MARRAFLFFKTSLAACWFLLWPLHPAQAQSSSFLNITAIETQVLPNAVRVTIRTDGTVNFGGDLNDFIDFNGFTPKSITSFRIRLPRARSRLPAFQTIGKYPVEAVVVSLGRTDFSAPYFSDYSTFQDEPRVDIEVRFFVPITVRRFAVNNDNVIRFGDTLGGRDVAVELSQDKSAIIITAIPDRADTSGADKLKRSPADARRHRLKIAPLSKSNRTRDALARAVATRTPPGRETTAQLVDTSTHARVDVLHAPLSDVLNAASRAMDVPFFAGASVADLDVSLFLPAATPDEFVRALQNAFDLSVVPRLEAEGGGWTFAREAASPIERVPLANLSPDRARLLLPDFLLPQLRADRENNALVVAASPRLVARLKSDLAILDRPRAQVRVEVTAWEFASSDDANLALQAARATPNGAQSVDSQSGSIAVSIQSGGVSSFVATVQALKARGRARLKVAPFITVANGERGTLFLGQTRFVNVIQQIGGQNEARAISLQIGYTLGVTPRLGASRDITLDLNPRFSTVDAIEAGSGLPTLGIREATATLRVRDGDAVLIGGLDTDLDFDTRRRGLATSSRSKSTTTLLLMVSARRV